MTAISYTAARENLASMMDKVCTDHAPVIITRKRDQSVIMLSLEDYEALQETLYILQTMPGISGEAKKAKTLKREKLYGKDALPW